MIIGMTSIVVSLIYFVIVAIIYFNKDRTKNFDNKIYSLMVIFNIIGLILELGCYYYVSHRESYIIINEIVNRLFLLYIVIWSFTLITYEFKVIYENNKNVTKFLIKNKKLFTTLFLGFLGLTIGLILISELKYFYDGKFVYSYGKATEFVFAPCIISFLIGGISICTNRKNIRMKKLIPFFALFLILGLAIGIRFINPGYLFITPMLTLVTFIMYFTIENPDVRMIEKLNLAKDTAEKANKAKSDFLSSMSHEIRTPLNAIVGFSECIKQSNTLEEAKENATDIITASNTLLEIVNGILDISKIESGKLELIEKNYNTQDLFSEIEKLIKARIGSKPLEFKINIAEDIPNTLYGDHANVKKILINLLTNAVKYTEHGYILLNVKCINVSKDICRLIISVKDTGRGIKSENIDKLFNKFQRLEEDKNTTTEGTGLGLAITKQLVEMMNGKIVVNSVYGEGSEFTVAIDQRISLEEVKKEERQEIVDLDLTNKSILIVDDNKLNLKVASKLMQQYHPNIDTCESGFECIDKIKNGNKYDLILLDDMMPKMKGTETLTRLKQIDDFNIPVIILTANAINGMKEHYLSYGFNDYLSKPIDKDELYNILRKYIKNERVEIAEKTYQDYSNKKILIVDDNKINIKIAAKTMDVYNFNIDIALSGQECLEKVKENTYDLIFMDYMMPEMDGIETLNKLKEDDSFKTKVVALTADAIDGARERFLNAGFDEYVSKPIDKDHLDNVINSLIGNNSVNNNKKRKLDIPEELYDMSKPLNEITLENEIPLSDKVDKIEESTKDIDYLKQKGIDVDKGINLLGSIEMYNETLNYFLDEIENRVAKLKTFKENNDIDNYAIEVHALKSDSKYLGFKKLAELALNHEMKSKENNIDYINNNFDELINELNKVLEIVKEYNK